MLLYYLSSCFPVHQLVIKCFTWQESKLCFLLLLLFVSLFAFEVRSVLPTTAIGSQCSILISIRELSVLIFTPHPFVGMGEQANIFFF